MNQEQTLDLFHNGRDAWNSWARCKLAQKEGLIKRGEWDAGADDEDAWKKSHPKINHATEKGHF